MNPGDIQIWRINDEEWWVGGGSAQDILAAYMEAYGVGHEKATGDTDTWPEPLSDSELDTLKYRDSDEDGQPDGEPRTFREQLAIEIQEGGDFPRLFAGSEY